MLKLKKTVMGVEIVAHYTLCISNYRKKRKGRKEKKKALLEI